MKKRYQYAILRENTYFCGTKISSIQFSSHRLMVRNSRLSNQEFSMNGKYRLQLVYIIIIPMFFLAFSVFYNPFDILEYYSGASGKDSAFHIIMLTSILAGVLAISRTMLHFVLKATDIGWINYIGWCLAEILGMSFFMALYTVLVKADGQNYFQHMAQCLKFSYLELIFIYVPMMLVRAVKIKNGLLEFKKQQDDNSLVRFYDEHQRLKLTIAPSSLLYVKSESNYLRICYLEAEKVREFVLRASMKSLEVPAFAHCLVRCQRSYFVNPDHVTVLRKDRDGFMYAEMNIPNVPAVPVSKQYFALLSELL